MEVVHFRDRAGHEPVAEYVERVASEGDPSIVAGYARSLDRLGRMGPSPGMPFARVIGSRARLYELRLRAHRIAYAVVHDEIMLLHAWRKQSQKLDLREAAVARRRLDEAVRRWRR